METKRTKTKSHPCRRLLSAAMALAMALTVLVSGVTVLAATGEDVGTVTSFYKYLILNQDANVPNVTFNFSIAAGAAVNATGSSPRIEAGIGAPTVDSVTFGPADTVSTTAEAGITLGTNQKFAKKSVNVDFSNVSFTAPGIYRYTITETASTASGIVNDTAATRTLDVYVSYVEKEDSDPVLQITGYVLQNGTAAVPTAKSDGFSNTYNTKNVTLKKVVTGNQGDRNKAFAFTVTIHATAGNVYNVVQGSSTTTLTVGANGTVSGTFNLKDNETLVIQGLAPADTFAIEEADYAAEGYTTSYQSNTAENAVNGRTLSATAMGDADQSVVFTNHREGTVPTGILMEFEPYLILGAVVIAGFLILFVPGKKRRAR